MLHSEPNNWEIFKIPPVQPIQYYSILKRKREFSQLIKWYGAQVCKHGYLHYCGIVPKSIRSTLNEEYELQIVFLGDVPSTSFIGFRVNVNSETFIQESNSLLLYLKQSEKAGSYFVNNNCIYVQCGKDAWEIFYHLYGIYLRKYALTVIGTQFYNHFVYQLCFQNEKQLLNMLFRGSKVIRVSKMSIYYRIHQKRKISVTDLIHMTLNMPESKRCVISFDSKESLSNQNIYTAVGNKIHVSKLVINKFKKQYHGSLPDNRFTLRNVHSSVLDMHSKFVAPEFKTHKEDIENKQLIANSSVLKRKFEETQNQFQKDSYFPKSPKISEYFKEENYWEQYTSVKPYPIKSFLTLLSSKSIIPDIFDKSKSCEVDSVSNSNGNILFSSVHSSESSSAFLVKECQNSPTVEETCGIYNVQNPNKDFQFDGNFINVPYFRGDKIMKDHDENIFERHDSSESKPNTEMYHQENHSFQRFEYLKSTSAVNPSKHIDQGEADEIFTTAAGKSINISNNSMLVAQRFIQGIFQDEAHQKLDRDAHCSRVENKQVLNVPAFKRKNSKEDEITAGEIDSNNYELGVGFSTAAGKTINVSQAAMRAAHKLIQDAFDNEDNISNTHKQIPEKLSIGDDDTMDKTHVVKFFQNAVLDEKEIVLESKKKNEPTSRKKRKSLGGRRNMRFYSDI